MSKCLKLRRNLKILFIGFILIILFSVFSSKKSQDITYINLRDFSENIENVFANPAQKSRPESPEFILVQKNSLQAALPPVMITSQVLGTLVGEYTVENTRKIIIEYMVEPGDSLSSIAAQFDISLDTVLWANNLNKNSIIKTGQKLVIPPVSGVIHHVKSGDTISAIAQTYKGKVEEIVAFNELSNENDIYIGDILIIPDGVMPAKAQPAPSSVPLADSQFIVPVSSPYTITQGLHWYNAIDFSHPGNPCGKPVFAAAGGTIQKTGYNRTAGNYVRILHPNGVITFYGHLSVITVKGGDKVNVGEIIGYTGNTGYTLGQTGCHLHFEVRGARNPFAK